MPSISHRLAIDWPPAEAFEDTDTIVLCSRQFHLVDIRIYKDQSTSKGRIEWAMTGQENPISDEPRVIEFQHEISTHHKNSCEGPYDSASFEDLPDGTSRETGVMINISTGKYEPYHEIWTRLDPINSVPGNYVFKTTPNGNEVKCVVTKIDKTKQDQYLGSVMRLGNFFQGILLNKATGKCSANRYYLKDGKWELQFEDGEELSKLPLIDSGEVSKVIQHEGLDWVIVESDN